MVGNASWGGDTLVEGVEHVEGSGKYRELYTCPISCLAGRNLCRERSEWGYMGSTDCVLFPNSQSISLGVVEDYTWRLQ